jgi:hypothetical protein
MLKFREWLFQENHDYDSDQDRLEHEAFEFIFEKIRRATELAVQDKSPRQGVPQGMQATMRFRDAMIKAWPESEQGRGIKFALPKDRFPSLESLRIRINSQKDESSADRIDGKITTIYVGTASLQRAIEQGNQEEINKHLRRISGSLNHEMTHLHHSGTDAGEETAEDAVKYMTNPGEMRAHAKDYAYTWAQDFPGQPFDVQKFVQKVIPTMVESKQRKATNYFVKFVDPETQAKYKHVADLGAANRQLLEMVAGYVGYYMKRTQPQKTRPQQPTTPQPTTQFQGFNTNDTRGWQQRQQYLNSIGVDTTGWGRAEIMRGVKNKA